MQLLFIDYTDLVLKAYIEKRESNRLSQLLMHPTAASIRQECLNVYNERNSRGVPVEENTLRAFFGVPPAGKNFGYIIERYNADKFRPLQSLIKGEIKNPAVITVELLAWLIDFNPRPLGLAQKVLKNLNELPNTDIPITGSTKIQEGSNNAGTNEVEKKEVLPIENDLTPEALLEGAGNKMPVIDNKDESKITAINLSQKSNHRRQKIITWFGLVIVILFGGLYGIQQFKSSGNTPFGVSNTACMYWDNDHYEQVPCNEEPGGRLILPLNEKKKEGFKRITREDTITERSINILYYISVNGKIEYYTEDGNHPVHINRTLKKLSRYMFEKHLRNP